MQKMSKSGRIDFMKIDIEGYEKEIFPDQSQWPVLCGMRCIVAELHDWMVPGCADALNVFLQVLVALLSDVIFQIYHAFFKFVFGASTENLP
jgi:hypothetical protein